MNTIYQEHKHPKSKVAKRRAQTQSWNIRDEEFKTKRAVADAFKFKMSDCNRLDRRVLVLAYQHSAALAAVPQEAFQIIAKFFA